MSRTQGQLHLPLMRHALKLAKKAFGLTHPNPLVGALLFKNGEIIGEGWHHQAGLPHAEIEALNDARRRRKNPRNSTLYVTLEPCSTHGRTPPCVEAIVAAGVKRVVVAATDPNPKHSGKGFTQLQKQGIEVIHGILSKEASTLNEAFNHWIVHKRPFVTLKAAATLDGKMATETGQSKWITGEKSRAAGMRLRRGAQAILVGINTVARDDPSLTWRGKGRNHLRRIVLDPGCRINPAAKVLSDEFASLTTLVVSEKVPRKKLKSLPPDVMVWQAPVVNSCLDLDWILEKLGKENVLSLLVEGGGETHAQFLSGGFAHRICFFYAPKVVAGRDAPKTIGGLSFPSIIRLLNPEWRRLGSDLMLTGLLPNHNPHVHRTC
ncbi:MAG: bifunctional diaminohydroxyphosphoribosylaminopyrimidine deaminase/5-amino-6-(5-phosphoribosylamino)uracil reductase RibD [Verrucomicrobiota bacterium]|nr:bifunctional diaminohydroxyphosphoribosylaminopyrimidine deaminase/5-amino-6-(5-phosphoribosylamino)uracil reductase RibD [Verrucomicrobiota bacterium]